MAINKESFDQLSKRVDSITRGFKTIYDNQNVMNEKIKNMEKIVEILEVKITKILEDKLDQYERENSDSIKSIQKKSEGIANQIDDVVKKIHNLDLDQNDE